MSESSLAEVLNMSWTVMKNIWWLILPAPLWFIFKPMWSKWAAGKRWVEVYKPVLLKIKIPKNQQASTKAMESTLAGLWGAIGTVKTVFDQEIDGNFQDYFSLEIASQEGDVGFYIFTSEKMRPLAERAFYAHFPDIEIVEAEDYTKSVPETIPDKQWDMWAGKLFLKKDQFRPIRTYPSFEDTETGEIVDPLANFLEILGSLGPGEHGWVQIQATPLPQDKRDEGYKVIEEILAKYNIGEGAQVDPSDPGQFAKLLPPPEMDMIKAINSKIGKPAFTCQVLFAYIARREVFVPSTAHSISGAFVQTESGNLNYLTLDKYYSTSAYYIGAKMRKAISQRRILDLFREREFQGVTSIFNVEELATLFHFPTISMKVPSLPRMDSRRASAPSNLPVEEK